MGTGEFLGLLCGLGVLFTFVTIVGHAIWVAIASAWQSISGQPKEPQIGSPCSACGNRFGVVGANCRICGAPAVLSMRERQDADLGATRRQLERWKNLGQITPEVYATLVSLTGVENPLSTTPAEAAQSITKPAPAPFALDPQEIAFPPISTPVEPPIPVELAHGDSEEIVVADIVVESPFADAARIPSSPSIHSSSVAQAVSSTDSSTSPLTAPTAAIPPPLSTPRRSAADMLQAFMEDKNIRWAEIISGILIVVSAVGLVISLRATLKDKIPYFPALSFMLVTAAIHAAGIYSLRRWNLKTTSRGVLIIATLLVPLSFLASIFLSGEGDQQRPATDPKFLIAVVIGLASFATMNYFAATALMRRGWWRMMVAVLGTSAGQLLINRLHPAQSTPVAAALLTSVPMSAFLVAVLSMLWMSVRRGRLGERPAVQFFLELGVAVFSLLAPVGLYVAKSTSASQSLGDLSPVLSLAASAVLASGLLAHRKMTGNAMTGYRTAGTALAILSAVVMLLMVGFAWPQLNLLIAVGVVNFVILTTLAVGTRLPVLHVPAVSCLALAYLSGFHLIQGLDPASGESVSAQLLRAIFTGRSGIVMTVFTTLVAATGGIMRRRREEDGQHYLYTSGGLAALCMAIAGYAGFFGGAAAQRDLATPIFLYFAIAAFAVGWVLRRAEGTLNGAALYFAACLHGLYWNEWLRTHLLNAGLLPSRPILVAFLTASLTFSLLAAVAWWRIRSRRPQEQEPESDPWTVLHVAATFTPLVWCAVATSLVATPDALAVSKNAFGEHAAYVACASVAWLCFSLGRSPSIPFSIFQLLSTISVIYATTSVCGRQSWWRQELLQATHVHIQFAVLAVWCAAWSALRWQFRHRAAVNRLWPPGWTIDQMVLGGLTVGIVLAALAGCLPGIQLEFGLKSSTANASEVAGSHREWYAGSAWIGWGLILAALAASYWEYRTRSISDSVDSPADEKPKANRASVEGAGLVLAGIVTATAAAPWLIAGRFDEQHAVGSATRWLFGLFAIVWCLPACYLGGRQSHKTSINSFIARPSRAIQAASLFFGAGVVLVLTTLAVWSASVGHRPGGPDPSSLFARMGSATSYAAPMAMLVVVLFAYATREAQAGYALSASFVFQYGLSLACLLPIFTSGSKVDELALAKLLQWNAVGLGLFTCAWSGARRWIEPDRVRKAWPPVSFDLLQIQVALLVLAQFCIAGWIACLFLFDPAGPLAVVKLLGRWPSYVALIAATAGLLWLIRRAPWSIPTHVTCVMLLVLVHLLAATMDTFDTSRQWWGHHTLSAGRMIAALMMTGWAIWFTWRPPSHWAGEVTGTIRASVQWATAAIVLGSLAAMRESLDDPLRPWWPSGIMLAGVVLASALAMRGRTQAFAYFSAVLALIAASVFWIGLAGTHPLHSLIGFIALHVADLGIVGCGWLACEIWWQRRREPGMDPGRRLPIHRLIAGQAIPTGIVYLCMMSFIIAIAPKPMTMNRAEYIAAAAAFISLFALQFGSMWERRSKHAIAGLYVWVLCIGAFVVERLALSNAARVVAMLSVVAAHVGLSGWLWSWGSKLAVMGHRLGVSEPVEGLRRTVRWLPAATLLLSAGVVSAGLAVVLGSESRELRVTAASLPFLVATGIAGLAQQHRRDAMQLISLIVAGLAGVFLGWADIHPDWSNVVVLLRSIRMLMAISVVSFIYGVVIVRVLSADNSWRQSVRRAAVIAAQSAVFALLLVLLLEVVTFEAGVGAPVAPIQIAAVSAVLIILLITLLSLAVLPDRDPLALSEKGRMLYVYGAQMVGGLLFAHIYLTMPWVFRGMLRPYWPYILVTIAFAGVGVGELFQRLGLRVLAEPFQRSGAFLPLIPAIGMWVAYSDSSYSLVMFAIGVTYLIVSFSQKSVWAGVAAAIAGNSSLWSLLNNTENWTFADHPQLWLIPPALSVLVAAQINRDRLSETQLAAIRYVGVIVIYLSSSIEMLRIGIGESIWPPMILITLSIIGVFFGIAMRVRAYLYLGAAFILVSLVSMVAHAARSINHVWPWWAFGILMGVVIMIIFGGFEARRTQILAMIERMRQWEK